MLVGKICLTGGPCAGKTTALSAIEENLQEQGYNVLIVPESATELIKGGIRPFGKKSVDFLLFQNLIMNYQLNKERIYEEAANSLEGKTVIIYDRGVMDNKDKYISPLSTRYASDEMQKLFSERFKFTTWRRRWVALAKAEKALKKEVDSYRNLEEVAYFCDTFLDSFKKMLDELE